MRMDSQREISGVVEAVSASSVGVAQLARSLSGKIPLGRNVSPGKATSGKMSSHGSLPSAERMTKVAMSSEDVIGSTSRQPRALPANVGVDSDRQSTKSGKSTSANGLAFGTEVLSDTTPVASTGMLPNNRTWTVKVGDGSDGSEA